MTEYTEISTNYLPDLYGYVLPIAHAGDDGESIGSAVAINIRRRHFVVTARHCMEAEPRLINGDFYLFDKKIVVANPVRIITRGWHPNLDIGFFETEDLHRPELQLDQLCCDRIVGGTVHIIGHPVCLNKWDLQQRTIEVTKTAFGTTLAEDSESCLTFDYPKEGFRFDPKSCDWVRGPFLESPKGVSGGGCFGITKSNAGELNVIRYRLLGIQYGWHSTERWVKAVPIERWLQLVQDQGNVGQILAS